MHKDLQFLPTALLYASLLGVGAGLVAGWAGIVEGFPLLALAEVRRALHLTLAAAAGFVLLYALFRRLLAGRLPPRLEIVLPAALAAAPLVAWGGYAWNRAHGIRPADLATPWAIRSNLVFLGICAALFLIAWWALRRPRPRRPRVIAALAAFAILVATHVAWAVLARGGDKPRPDVLVILVDALRADHLGVYGHSRPTSPAIDALARDGVVFTQAISQSTFTKTAIASLFTGRDPYQHGVYWGSGRDRPGAITSDLLGESETTLAETLRDAGYLTAAWVQNSHLRDFTGFAQGFVSFHDQQGPIDRIHRRFERFLRGPGRRYPFFAYLHYIDLHDPYRPPPSHAGMFGSPSPGVYRDVDFAEWGAYLEAVREGRIELEPEDVAQMRADYDALIRYVDDHVGRLLDELRELGLYDDTLIVLTSDHGDGFLEHGFISHSTTPYDELVRVPLVVKLPGGRAAGRRVTEQVRLVDVLPTVLAEIGLEPPTGIAGCGLQPLLSGEPFPERCRYALSEIAEDGAYPIVAVRDGRFKYIHHEKKPDELYDLERDPGERRNLAADEASTPVAERLAAIADAVVAERARLDVEQIELDERMIQELKSLGYIGKDKKRDPEDEKRP